MLKKSCVTDLEECRILWEKLIRPANVSDTWEFRICFQRHFKHSPCFILLEDSKGIVGMLPLSYLEKEDRFLFFPGETWKGRSWLERTPYFLREQRFGAELFFACPDNTCLRYMEAIDGHCGSCMELDEISYVLHPSDFDFSISRYLEKFSTKRMKGIKKEIEKFLQSEGVFQTGRLNDFDQMAQWNMQRFNSDSYFFDRRFRESFRDAMVLLYNKGWLRMVSLLVKGKPVAVDLGAVYDKTYTIFLGGTHSGFSGVAKAINMNHLEFAFRERISRVDFLCGDFHWKKLWRLEPVPLYNLALPVSKNGLRSLLAAKEILDYLPEGIRFYENTVEKRFY